MAWIRPRWVFTVLSETLSFSPISALVSPSATATRMSSSRTVRGVAGWWAVAVPPTRIDASLRETIVEHHGAELAEQFEKAHPAATQPLVRAHPDTGRPCLYICPMYLERLPELRPGESDMLLAHLGDVAVDPNHTVRWYWSEGDVAIWDEACTLHRALDDHRPSVRRMRRCTTEGEPARRAFASVQ